jgi:hypothetical protein
VPPTIFYKKIKAKGSEHSLFPSERKAKIPPNFPNYLGKIRGVCSTCVPVHGRGVSLFAHLWKGTDAVRPGGRA